MKSFLFDLIFVMEVDENHNKAEPCLVYFSVHFEIGAYFEIAGGKVQKIRIFSVGSMLIYPVSNWTKTDFARTKFPKILMAEIQ